MALTTNRLKICTRFNWSNYIFPISIRNISSQNLAEEEKRKPCPAVAKYGPYISSGELAPKQLKAWCTCGLSNRQPWCNGAHKRTGFIPLIFNAKEEATATYSFCGCKHTKTPPYCDGSHNHIKEMVKERQDACHVDHATKSKICVECGWTPQKN